MTRIESVPPQAARPNFGIGARQLFPLAAGITYLNHGGYGLCSRSVMDAAEALRRHIEANPTLFLREELPLRLRQTAGILAAHLNAKGEDIVFTGNASDAINAVLRSFVLMPGDEVVTTSHAYGAVRRTLEFVTERAGARLVYADLPYPIADKNQALDALQRALSARTRLAVLDHVTSQTAIRLPLGRMVAACAERGVKVMIDGAHGPGQVPVDLGALEELGVHYYIGSGHKWLGTPRGTGFLWTAQRRQAGLRPTIISHFIDDGYTAAFDWPGTRDFTPWLCLPEALAFRARFTEPAIDTYCRSLAMEGAGILAEAWGVKRMVPNAMMGFMTSVPFPIAGKRSAQQAEAVWRAFRDRGLEPAVHVFEGRVLVRASAFVYSTLADFEALAAAGKEILAG